MSGRKRRRSWEDDDRGKAIDPKTGKPLQFHEESGPIDPLEDQLDEYTPKYRTVQDAVDAAKRQQAWKEEEGEDDE
jgi:hypothetical protein